MYWLQLLLFNAITGVFAFLHSWVAVIDAVVQVVNTRSATGGVILEVDHSYHVLTYLFAILASVTPLARNPRVWPEGKSTNLTMVRFVDLPNAPTNAFPTDFPPERQLVCASLSIGRTYFTMPVRRER
jgi:hypothetical protein